MFGNKLRRLGARTLMLSCLLLMVSAIAGAQQSIGFGHCHRSCGSARRRCGRQTEEHRYPSGAIVHHAAGRVLQVPRASSRDGVFDPSAPRWDIEQEPGDHALRFQGIDPN